MNNKNILMCLNSLGIGGVETACVTQIAEYARRNYNVYVLAEKGIYTEKLEKVKNVKCINFNYEHKNGIELSKINFVINIIKKHEINMVIIHKLECILSVFPACILTNIPYVAYLHMGLPDTYNWYLGNLNVSKSFIKAYLENAYKIIGISNQTIEENIKLFNIKKEKYEIIPNAIDFREFNNSENTNTEKILLITRLDKDKGNGVKNAIEFYKEYKKDNPNISMDIIGDGAERKNIESIIKEQKLNINLLGPKNNISEFIKKYKIVLGVGRCIQEAIAMKKFGVVVGYEGFKRVSNI